MDGLPRACAIFVEESTELERDISEEKVRVRTWALGVIYLDLMGFRLNFTGYVTHVDFMSKIKEFSDEIFLVHTLNIASISLVFKIWVLKILEIC